MLTGDKGAVLTQLSRQKTTFEQLVRLSPSLAEAATTYENALLELHEVSHSLRTYEARIEHNPERAAQLNTRLELIARLKRKYGSTVADVKAYLQHSKAKLNKLENADDQIAALQEKLAAICAENNDLAAALTNSRRQAAQGCRQHRQASAGPEYA